MENLMSKSDQTPKNDKINVYSSYHNTFGEVDKKEWEDRRNPHNNGYIKVVFSSEYSQEVPIVYIKVR